ncbi:MAG: ribonuclease HII, partial [Gemmatimonadota bacterium]|nr:ribonuclease HII [Gemmatimonadota bacterium]
GDVAGIDEAGRGPLAGPVVAAAVVLDPSDPIDGLGDSKKLTPRARERLFAEIRSRAVGIGIGWAGHGLIDRINILRATHFAMRRAVERLPHAPSHLLVDGLPVPGLPCRHTALVKGDSRCASIMAASIVAKVVRDRHMIRLAKRFPEYGFERHKGYPAVVHREALERVGPCVHHRRTFSGVRERIPEGAHR